ncbi:bifunctional ADP-dependent (S)-NAD(P)H-hydrate dehydratase/NAD(P)H-hydrate epimerase [Solemya pervernicosa gill symbiont]|uniref:Bifunctional NAD(P)H-hydrate repair enzyme n=2 Tax=Gammaproteobacteria incertae sedis TaxID=118884 RepID=A0A1T2L7J6_9GAMM|nr:NAD(P)H-hydrate dehydratase [Candidatus Reidiella endopervernicosa]OOZ41079.1 bifunctional ADP-dependent (S)-NAD(P)H-hydrate dehydratase/NAD(P)H-hydrate epimerase [Solemya pervernicosa gill symbiont]QKQ26240.1 NAD(P)H-hydrate dehydratase [Candidatus Reidiella endopervernicosa]
MKRLPYNIYSPAQVRELDRRAIESFATPGYELMKRAGAAIFSLIRTRWTEATRIAILCGGGNNGGDGYVAARLAHEAGLRVELIAIEPVANLQGDAKLAADDAIAAGIATQPFSAGLTEHADLIVDALFGIGLDREVTDIWREAIDVVNAERVPVLAVDIPSGLHAEHGEVLWAAIKADVTLTFIGLKSGLMTGVGPDHSGELHFDDLMIPEGCYEDIVPTGRRIDYDGLSHLLTPRRATSHKGDFGHLLVVGGDYGMAGAVRLAAEAGLRSGAGLVSVATRREHCTELLAARPELMCYGVENADDLLPLLERATVVAIGPGLGRGDWGAELLGRVLESSQPLVVDADALNLLALDPTHRGNWIMTPHPGEAARLLCLNTEEVQTDRHHAIRELVHRYGGSAILKGAGTLTVTEDGMIALCNEGNPGMASGGMGDLLTGIAAALLAQGFRLADAARLATAIHARAGDLAAASGERGLLASDLFDYLPTLLNPTR